MSSEARTELAVVIEEAVRATSGVRTVYRSGSLISNLLHAGAAALRVRNDDEPIVAVTPADDGVAVEVSIGVDAEERSADTLRAVHVAVDKVLAKRDAQGNSITLTIVHVQ